MSNSEEEEIARNYICFGGADVVVVILDATSLERNLNLVYQIMEITDKVVVCVNLLDEAKKKGINIDLKEMERLLGVPVVGTIARKKKTLNRLMDKVAKIANGEIPSATVYEDEDFRVILDLGPASKGHCLILPKHHFADICALDDETGAKALPLAAKIGAAMKRSLGCTGFNVVQNNGTSAGQTVFHFHIHVIPRYEGGPDMVSWTPGHMESEELAAVAEQIKKEL